MQVQLGIVAMKLCIWFALLSALGALGLKNGPEPKGAINSYVNNFIKNYVHELSQKDPLHIDEIHTSYSSYDVQLYNITVEGLSNVRVTRFQTSGIFSIRINIELLVPSMSGMVEEFIVTGQDSVKFGNASLELDNFSVNINAKVNLVSEKIQEFTASFHLGGGHATVQAFVNNKNNSITATENVNNYLNSDFNTDYELHQILLNYLKQFLNID